MKGVYYYEFKNQKSNDTEKHSLNARGLQQIVVGENLINYVVDNIVKSSYTYVKPRDKWLVSTETTDGYVTAYTYSETDELVSKVKTQNGTEVERDEYTYGTNGSVSKHTHTENGTSLTYHYGSKGEITKVEHNGFAYNYEYDNFLIDGYSSDNYVRVKERK